MEDKIEIGEYVRTKKGYIGKIIDIKKHEGMKDEYYLDCMKVVSKENIVKHSKNITDLIETMDILKIREDNSIAYLGLEKDEITLSYQDIINEIKNGKIELLEILTHEQFENNSYKVGV